MLGLLVFACFESAGFRVKCAEAGWLLESSFHGLFTTALTLQFYIVVSASQNLSFGSPGSSTLAPGHFGTLGTLCGTMVTAGRTCGVRKQIYSDLEMLWGPNLKVCWTQMGYVFFVGLVSRYFVAPTFASNSKQLELLKQGFRIEVIAEVVLAQVLVLIVRCLFLKVFRKSLNWSSFPDFLASENWVFFQGHPGDPEWQTWVGCW